MPFAYGVASRRLAIAVWVVVAAQDHWILLTVLSHVVAGNVAEEGLVSELRFDLLLLNLH